MRVLNCFLCAELFYANDTSEDLFHSVGMHTFYLVMGKKKDIYHHHAADASKDGYFE